MVPAQVRARAGRATPIARTLIPNANRALDLNPPEAVRRITRRLEEAGHETWTVGGAVRDALLGLPAVDWDLATAARPRQVRRLFRRTVPIGIEHGTVGILGEDRVLYEVTTFRRDVETFGRRAVVEFADHVEEDLSRRDFTCNALAWHALTGELRDPYGGLTDLRAGILRTVGDPDARFAEDFLRVLRALRFAGQFRFTIEPATWRALVRAVPNLPRLSAERIREELWKTMTKTHHASGTLSLYAASGALDVLYPELRAVIESGGQEEPGRDPWTVSLFAVDAIAPTRPLLRVAAWLHRVHANGPGRGGGAHDAEGAGRTAGRILRRLRASNMEVETVTRLVTHAEDRVAEDTDDASVRRWLHRVGPDLVPGLLRLQAAIWRGSCRVVLGAQSASPPDGCRPQDSPVAGARKVRRVLRGRPPLAVSDLAIDGNDLKRAGLQPGPRFGEILRELLDRVIERPELNERDTLLDLVRRELTP